MRSDTKVQVVCVALAIGLVATGSLLQGPINEQRSSFLTGFNDELTENLPPKVAFVLTSMGAFRGLAIDYLWIKASKLREEGRHFQSLQLARWICDLQPRFPSVWEFQAWEMAYNISVTTHTPEERWTWVYGAIKLLRDKGIPYNPACLPLYKEVAWIYFHKMGDILDDMHWAYKAEWAVLMQRVLGAPDPNATAEEAIDAIRIIGDAPRTLDELIQAEPRVASYVGMLEQAGIELSYPLLAAAVEAPVNTGPTLESLALDSTGDANEAAAVDTLPGDDSWTDVRDKLVAWVRADILRREFKLDPSWMVGLMEKFGPLDWRATYSQALYWSTYGDFKARKVALLANWGPCQPGCCLADLNIDGNVGITDFLILLANWG